MYSNINFNIHFTLKFLTKVNQETFSIWINEFNVSTLLFFIAKQIPCLKYKKVNRLISIVAYYWRPLSPIFLALYYFCFWKTNESLETVDPLTSTCNVFPCSARVWRCPWLSNSFNYSFVFNFILWAKTFFIQKLKANIFEASKPSLYACRIS